MSLHSGDVGVLREARKVFRSEGARRSLKDLAALIRRLDAAGLGARLSLDLGEVRGASYYTGPSFTLLARGPGEPVGAGGRYDGLLARFGAAQPATGFGIDLANLEWALSEVGRRPDVARRARFVVAGGKGSDRDRVAEKLRGADASAARGWTRLARWAHGSEA